VEVRQLRYFAAVVEEMHFGRAAARLNVVQPAVSQQIRKLEKEVGLRLLDRDRRGVCLTTAGEALLPSVRAALEALDQVSDTARRLAAMRHRPQIRVGTPEGLGARLEQILTFLAQRQPVLQVRLVNLAARERVGQVRDGRLDAAIVRMPRTDPGLQTIPLWHDRLVVALPAGHALAGSSRLELGRLAQLPLRLMPRSQAATFTDLVVDACRAAGFEPVLGECFTTVQNTLAQLGTGPPAWTLVYEEIARSVATRRVAFRPLADPGLAVPAALVVRELTAPLRQLVDACRAR